jgi:hypothetical protein
MPGAGGRVSGTAVWAPDSNQLAITLTVPGGLSSSSPADIVTITLPSGLFSGTPVLSGTDYTGTPSVSAPFPLTKITSSVAAAGSTTITITGMTLSPSAYSISKQLTVKTTKDINTVGIPISGIT